jgi:hypothetical protein
MLTIILLIAVVVSGIVGFVSGAKYSSVYEEKLAKVEGEIKRTETNIENRTASAGYDLLRFLDRIKAHL